MNDPATTATQPSPATDKPVRAPKPRGGAPAAEGSAPSAALASTDGPTEPMARPAFEERPPVDRQTDDREPDSEPPVRRSFGRGERRAPDGEEIPVFAVDAMVKALAKQGYKLTKEVTTEEEPEDDGVRGSIADEDVPFLAAALSDKQLQDLLAIRAKTRDVKKWKQMGATPGLHWIPTQRARCTLNGEHGAELVPGVPVLMSALDEATTKRFLADGTIHAPGQEPAHPHKRA